MIPFQSYSNYYDKLYQEKDYKKECDFLEEIFRKYSAIPTKSILDLGCGTGGHSLILAERGYQTTGVDLSERMLEIAKKKAKEKNQNIDFVQGNIKNINLGKKFDAVISMFAVVGYLTETKDIISALERAGRHLDKGGIFTFDCWFGPAVLVQNPEKREKIIKEDGETIKRTALPTLNLLNQTVEVDYEVSKIKEGQVIERINEKHKMRFFFPQEIKYFLKTAGFEVIKICPFMELDKEPGIQDWNISVIAKKL